MRQKYNWLFAALMVAALVISACTGVAPAVQAPAAETSAAPEEAAAAPAEGDYAAVDPTGQTVVWWHNHTGSRDENLKPLIEEFNKANEWGITIDAQSQGDYDAIRDKVNASIAAGEQPAALIVGYQNDQSFYQLNDTLLDLNTLVDDLKWGLTAEDKADFYPVFLEQSVNPLFDNQRLGFPQSLDGSPVLQSDLAGRTRFLRPTGYPGRIQADGLRRC
ncbi:MAG: extracellular solute-binding protein [Anaerolineales bacterium]|nr:extracellular solute-binding protein [Anaerolineales bacterium]